MLDKDGKLPRVGRALMADAIGTVAGACLGTSTVTSYVEAPPAWPRVAARASPLSPRP